jgi:hypothetical protein
VRQGKTRLDAVQLTRRQPEQSIHDGTSAIIESHPTNLVNPN